MSFSLAEDITDMFHSGYQCLQLCCHWPFGATEVKTDMHKTTPWSPDHSLVNCTMVKTNKLAKIIRCTSQKYMFGKIHLFNSVLYFFPTKSTAFQELLPWNNALLLLGQNSQETLCFNFAKYILMRVISILSQLSQGCLPHLDLFLIALSFQVIAHMHHIAFKKLQTHPVRCSHTHVRISISTTDANFWWQFHMMCYWMLAKEIQCELSKAGVPVGMKTSSSQAALSLPLTTQQRPWGRANFWHIGKGHSTF